MVRGEARGFWFFEATFPVTLLDANGEVVAQTYASALTDWMTEDFVPFEAEVVFSTPKTRSGFLVLQKSNPSGLPEFEDALRVPIVFAPTASSTRKITLFYYKPQNDAQEDSPVQCSESELVPVERDIPVSPTPIQDAIRLLLRGKENLTQSERLQHITTEYPLEGFALRGASLRDGILTLEFADPYNKTSGGSCRVTMLRLQIEATAKQFPEVKEVRILPETLFQP